MLNVIVRVRRLLLMLAAVLSITGGPSAANATAVDSSTPIIFADKSLRVLEDPDGSLTLDAALARRADFRLAGAIGAPKPGSHYWVLSELDSRLDIDRELRVDAPGWYESFSYVIDASDRSQSLRQASLFWVPLALLGNTNPFVTAATTESSQWPVFTLRRGEKMQVLTHLVPNGNLQPAGFGVQFIDHARYLELRRYGLHLEGILAGVLCALVVFGWASAYHNRDRTSVAYATWIMFALLSASTLPVHDGVRLFEFYIDIGTGHLGKVSHANILLTSLAYCQSMGYVIFARNFLEMKSRMPRAFMLTNVYLAFTLLHLFVLFFVDHGLGVKGLWLPLWGAILVTLVTIYACAYLRYREGLRVAKFFMLAMIPYIIFRFIFFLGLINVPSPFTLLPKTGFGFFIQNPNTAQAIGVCCEALIMALAVFSKNRWLQQELKENIQAQAALMQNQNQVLEATVAERTRELAASMAKVEQQHEMVVDSINYASRLQKAQLPRTQRLDGQFSSIYTIWEPRDTIGGDVWWASLPDAQGRIVLALADSTGHGVPGAMLSVLISTSLERMFATSPDLDPSAALMALDRALRIGLNQDSAQAESDDGCDAAMVRIDRQQRTLEFAGAKLGLLHLWPDGRVDRLQPSRVSLGYQQPPAEAPALQRIDYVSGSTFVIVSDGFTDQIGSDSNGNDGNSRHGRRAYGYRRLVELLQASRGEPAETIARRMRESLQRWQGDELRRDDVTAIVFALD
jgi:serine phosphatase RsbU (regulator of sigma subunit)